MLIHAIIIYQYLRSLLHDTMPVSKTVTNRRSLWGMAPCRLVDRHRCFGRTSPFHVQSKRQRLRVSPQCWKSAYVQNGTASDRTGSQFWCFHSKICYFLNKAFTRTGILLRKRNHMPIRHRQKFINSLKTVFPLLKIISLHADEQKLTSSLNA